MLQKSEILGLVLPDLHGEFYSEIIRGANAQARTMDYSLIVSSAKDADDMQALLKGFLGRSIVDGIAVLVSELTSHIQDCLDRFRIPFVVLDEDVEGARHDCVVIDQRRGALALMRHLVQRCGARRIFFVGGLQTNVDTIARLEAYQDVLYESNLPFSTRDIYYLDYEYDTAYTFATGHVRDWAGAGHCVFAANDEMASAIVDAANDAGLRVPADLAVVGFDDTRVARMTRPPLTTVRVPMSEMGAEAIRLLCDRLTNPDRDPVRLSLHPELVVRQSCGAK
jgi:LacI family transcriptional regulator